MENMLQQIKELQAQVKALTTALLLTQEELEKAQHVVDWCLNNERDKGPADA